MTVCAIQTERLGKQFHRRDVLNNICFEVSPGECIAVTGENSAGKTTLLKCLAGTTRPSSGSVSWFGQQRRTVRVRRMIGTVTHDPQVYPHLTVRENLVFAARMYDVARPHQRVGELIEVCGLERSSSQLLVSMSRGMRQRVAIARSVVHAPKILLLDEPFTGLDSSGREMLVDLLARLRARNTAICFTTHQDDYVCQLATRVTQLHNGQLHDRELQSTSCMRQVAA
ncbi:MAG: ABC transporter ATP-binding protein [Planctomycetales bacterium]|nr:ABC transporter ATP-binding protein [Planctomycetales bacterium]